MTALAQYAPAPLTLLPDPGWNEDDAQALWAHLGRKRIHASVDRHFERSYFCRLCKRCSMMGAKQATCSVKSCVPPTPRLYRRSQLADKGYIVIAHEQYHPLLVVDIDIEGAPGQMNEAVASALDDLVFMGLEPNWTGVSLRTGKCQLVWYIDPVYAGKDSGRSRPLEFLLSVRARMNEHFGADPAFSARFMRNPLCTQGAEYAWRAWHHEVASLTVLADGLDHLAGREHTAEAEYQWLTASGAELLKFAIATRLAHAASPPREYTDGPGYVRGVFIVREGGGEVCRNHTAFRYALASAGRAERAGKKVGADLIISAFEYAYQVAHDLSDKTLSQQPSERELVRMANRILRYLEGGGINQSRNIEDRHASGIPARERTVLARFGARGGKVSAERRWADRDSELAQGSLAALNTARTERTQAAQAKAHSVSEYIRAAIASQGRYPTRTEIMGRFGVSESSAKRYLRSVKQSVGV